MISKMGIKHGPGLGLCLLVLLLATVEQSTAQVTARSYGKPFLPKTIPATLLLKSVAEAKEACDANGLVLATKAQVEALPSQNGGTFKLTKCGFMADGKAGKINTAGAIFEACPDKPTAPAGYNAWCIEAPDYTCPVGWTWLPDTLSCFLFAPKDKNASTFDEAKAKCGNLGGYLATIDTVAEQTALEKMATTPAFIGLNDGMWNDGTMRKASLPTGVTFVPPTSTTLKCAGVSNVVLQKNKWSRLDCATKNAFICEMDLGSAPNYTVTFRTKYKTHTHDRNCFRGNFLRLADDTEKMYKNIVLCPGVMVDEPKFSYKTVSSIYKPSNKLIYKRLLLLETFTISSKNYTETLACARTLASKLPAEVPKALVYKGCPELTLASKRDKINEKIDCGSNYYNGKRSCLPMEKACTAFKKTDVKDLLAAQEFREMKGYVMTQDKCEALCRNMRDFQCSSFSFTAASKMCKLSPQKVSLYKITTWPAKAGTNYFERICPNGVAPSARVLEIKLTYKAATKPACTTNTTKVSDAGFVVNDQLEDEIPKAMTKLMKESDKCGYKSAGMSLIALNFNTYTPFTSTGEEVQVGYDVHFVPLSLFTLATDNFIQGCLNDLAGKLKFAAKYSLGPSCGDVEALLVLTGGKQPTPKETISKTSMYCNYIAGFPYPYNAYFPKDFDKKLACYSEKPKNFITMKEKCGKASVLITGEQTLPACSSSCDFDAACQAIIYNNNTFACRTLKSACGSQDAKVKLATGESYYVKEYVVCEGAKAYQDIRLYIKEVLELYLDIDGSKRDDLCSNKDDAMYSNIQKSFTTLKASIGPMQIMTVGISLSVANNYRNETCSNNVNWAKTSQLATCKLDEAKKQVITLMSEMLTAEIRSYGAIFKISKKFISMKRSVMVMVSTCSTEARLSVFEGFSFMFYTLRYIYPDIEPFLGPKAECQDKFFTESLTDFINFKGRKNRGVNVDDADVCRKFTTLTKSMYLVNSCQSTVKQSAEITISAFNTTMVDVCKQSSTECVKSTYMQCLQKRTHNLTRSVVEGKGVKSAMCVGQTKENFNKELQSCLTNSKGCSDYSINVASRTISILVAEFLTVCSIIPGYTIIESKECKSAEATVCQTSLSTIMFNNIAAGSEASQRQTCSSFEATVTCVRASIANCSPPTRLNQLESMLNKRAEILATQTDLKNSPNKPPICAFKETDACITSKNSIILKFTQAVTLIKAGNYECGELALLRVSFNAFIKAKACHEVTQMYVKASFETIEFYLRDLCSACAQSSAMDYITKYHNAFLSAVFEFWKYEKSAICTGAMPTFLLEGNFESAVEDCKEGGEKVVGISKMTLMYKEGYCKKRDFTWLVPKTETCEIKVVEACFESYRKSNYLSKMAGDDESRRRVCAMYTKLSLCVQVALVKCNTLTNAGFLAGLSFLRTMVVDTCDLKPEEECKLEEAHECLTDFKAQFSSYRALVVDKKKPKPNTICGIGVVTRTCITKYTAKCGSKNTDFVLYLKKTFEMYFMSIKPECDKLVKKPCNQSSGFACVSTYAKNVTETLTMVDRRTAFLCTKSVEKQVDACAAETTYDCGERSKSFITTVKGLMKSTKTVCKQLVCRQDEAKANILFILDASGSILKKNFKKCLDFTKKLVEKFEIGEDMIRVATMTYATSINYAFGFDRFYKKDTIIDSISKIRYTQGGTNTHIALEEAQGIIKAIQKKRGNDVPSIVIITTDGKSKSKSKTLKEAENLKKIPNLTVYSIGIGKNTRKEELVAMATNPKTMYTVEDFDKLDDIISGLSQGITCEGLKKNGTTGIIDPPTCILVEAQKCVETLRVDMFVEFAKEGEDAIKKACLSYKKSIECLKLTLATCSGPTAFRYVEALYLLVQSSMTVCKEFLPKPRETCKLEEAESCFKELKTTISKVKKDDFTKVCTEINEKQGCVYDRVAGCTDFTTYFWLAHVNAITYHVKTTKKCQGIIKPPVVTGKECDDAEATKCMFEFEEHAVQSAFAESYGTVCLKLLEFEKCITALTPECTKKQTDARLNRFKIKLGQIKPECITMNEVPECKFKEIREKLEGFTKDMLKSLMLTMKSENLCDDLQDALKFATDNMDKCSVATMSKIDSLAKLVMKQLDIECKDKEITYVASVKPSCDINYIRRRLNLFVSQATWGLANGKYEFCGTQVTVKGFIDVGLRGCPAKFVLEINTEWTAIITKIGTNCNKRFDVDFPNPKIKIEEGTSITIKYKFIGCINALCQGETNCKVKIFHTLTNLRGNARCGKNERYLIQGAFGPAADGCGFDLTEQNCASNFELVIHGRVFYVYQKSVSREVIFYARVTINGVITYVKLTTTLLVTFVHHGKPVKPCTVWGDPHIQGPYVKPKYTILNEILASLLKYKTSTGILGRDIQGVFQQCKGYKRKVSCMCAIYIQCGGGVIKLGACVRKTPKKGRGCRNKKGFGGKCSTKVPTKNFMEIETMYNGNIDQCQILQKNKYQYVIYQPNGRKIVVKMSHVKTLRVLASYISHLPTDKRDAEGLPTVANQLKDIFKTEARAAGGPIVGLFHQRRLEQGLCFSSKATYKTHSLPFGSTFVAENWKAYTGTTVSTSCLCTTSGKGSALSIQQSCKPFQISRECNYNKRAKIIELTKTQWSASRRITQSTSARRKRAVATNPFAMDPNAKVDDKWGTIYTEPKARKECQDYYDTYKNKELKDCLDQTKMNYTAFFDQCIGDIKNSDTNDFIENSASTCYTSCIAVLQSNTTYMNSPAGQDMATKIAAQSCPSDCSKQGNCVGGICSCTDPWTGEACDVNKNDKPVIISIGSNGGVCDPATTDCAIIMVQAGSVQFIPGLTCHYLEQKFGPTTQSDVGQAGKVRGENVGGSVQCVLPKSASYLIALSNDGKNPSGASTYLVYNPKCETCDIIAGTCKPSSDAVCRVGHNCYTEGEMLASDECFVCDTKASTSQLVKKKTVKCGHSGEKGGLDTTDIIIIAVTVGGIVIGLVVFLIYKLAVKPQMDAKAKAKEIQNDHDMQQTQQNDEPRYSDQPQSKYLAEAGPSD